MHNGKTQLTALKNALRASGNPSMAKHAQGFFKTGKDEYGEGDVFLGIRVPVVRKLATAFKQLPIEQCTELLHSRYHEERLCALVLLIQQYERGDASTKTAIYQTYLDNLQYINNWDLVDISAHLIIGRHLFARERTHLYQLARATDLWERRIAIVATLYFIRNHDYADTLTIAEMLLDHPEDLIHKAVGWMLREVGKRDLAAELRFLDQHYAKMPRTMLRYAIEKFDEPLRKAFLKGTR